MKTDSCDPTHRDSLSTMAPLDIRSFFSPPTHTQSTVHMSVPEKSKGSIIASTGNTAEELLCTQASVRTALAAYFGKEIALIEKIPSKPHPKKSDLRITFVDGSTTTLQNKNGKGDGRGYSVDRRPVHEVAPGCPALTETLRTVCLHEEGARHSVERTVVLDVIRRCILGTEESTKPAYFLHSSISDGQIASLSIATTEGFMGRVCSSVYDTAVSKKTCVHMSPHIYLQRKGGGVADTRPNDIQMKFRLTPDIAEVFTPLVL
jgi:hypothetical protein